MKRRDFIAFVGGAAAWPLTASAQPPDRRRRIGVLMNVAGDDPEAQSRLAVFTRTLDRLGWTIGSNVYIDYRAAAGEADRIQALATELVV